MQLSTRTFTPLPKDASLVTVFGRDEALASEECSQECLASFTQRLLEILPCPYPGSSNQPVKDEPFHSKREKEQFGIEKAPDSHDFIRKDLGGHLFMGK